MGQRCKAIANWYTSKTSYSSLFGRDDTRHRYTAQVKISGPASLFSNKVKPDIMESISWMSDKEKVLMPFLWITVKNIKQKYKHIPKPRNKENKTTIKVLI